MKKITCMLFLSISTINSYTQPGCASIHILNNISTDHDFTLSCEDSCVSLSTYIVATSLTTDSYTVSSIPFSPPYAFNTGDPILVNADDIWSGPVPLPFGFCFYGNTYHSINVGANGLISFDPYVFNDWCEYDYETTPIPTPGFVHKNAIYGVYEDIHPGEGGHMYAAVLGTAPCRTFVVNWHEMPLYGNETVKNTYQIVLYENTNIIEVYVLDRNCCSRTNRGNGIIGIQDSAGNRGLAAPGRNFGKWITHNEAWRFTPEGNPSYSVNWYDAQGQFISAGENLNICTTSDTSYIARLEYNACNGSFISLSDTVHVAVSSPPPVTITASRDTLCQGDSATLTAISTQADSYEWSTGVFGAAINIAPSSSTTYNVTSTYGNCSVTASYDIVVIDLEIFVTNDTICRNQEGVLTGSGAETYLWDNGYTGSVLTESPDTTTTYYVTGTDLTGCSASAKGTIFVLPEPTMLITNDTICENEEGTLHVSGADTYRWSNGNTGSMLTESPDTTTTYYVTGTDLTGCSASAKGTIFVLPEPTILITNDTICENEEGTLRVSGADTYRWSNGNTGSMLTESPDSSTVYFVTGTGSNGCSASGEGTIIVNLNPEISVLQSSICKGETGELIASGAVGYLWDTGDTGTILRVSPDYNTMYSVTGTDRNGCSSSAFGIMEVFQNPSAGFYASSYSIEAGNAPVYFTDQSTGDPVSWMWDFGDGNISFLQNPSNRFTSEDHYTVLLRIKNESGCWDTASCRIEVIPAFTFYLPNAFTPNGDGLNDLFYPSCNGVREESYEMLIFDRWGKLVFKSTSPSVGWDGRSHTGETLPGGVYIYTIRLRTIPGNEKLLKGEIMLVR